MKSFQRRFRPSAAAAKRGGDDGGLSALAADLAATRSTAAARADAARKLPQRPGATTAAGVAAAKPQAAVARSSAAATTSSAPPPGGPANAAGRWAEPRDSAYQPAAAAAKKTQVAPEPSPASLPPSGGDSAAPAPTSAPNRVYLPPSQDLTGLVVSGWFVPTVRTPLKHLKTLLFAAILQGTFVGYIIADTVDKSWELSPCATPALLQLVAVYSFSVAMLSEMTCFRMISVVATCQHVREGADGALVPIRPTNRAQRALLMLVPLAEMCMELLVYLVGVAFLLFSPSVDELILNTVAVNFITTLDEMMLQGFVNKASLERLAKYQLEGIWGVEEGDTKLKHATAGTRRLIALMELSMYLCLGVSTVLVGIGQLWGTQSPGSVDSSCTVLHT